ncbi:MAG: hypothetical protein ACRD11_12445 [Terriglobia bacterium]
MLEGDDRVTPPLEKWQRKRKSWLSALLLLLVEHAASDGTVLAALESALSRSLSHIQNEGDIYADSETIAELEWPRVEQLLGVAFVTCQVDITSVVSQCGVLLGVGALGTKPRRARLRRELMNKVNPTVAKTMYTQMVAIGAFANYFKHVDDWDGRWSELKNPIAHETAVVVTALGARQGPSRI